MDDRPTDALWGIGAKTARKLAGIDIATVADLAAAGRGRPRGDVRASIRPVAHPARSRGGHEPVSAEPWIPRA